MISFSYKGIQEVLLNCDAVGNKTQNIFEQQMLFICTLSIVFLNPKCSSHPIPATSLIDVFIVQTIRLRTVTLRIDIGGVL